MIPPTPVTAEIVCVGLITADLIVDLPRWPDPDGRMVVDAIHRSGGGPAATAAVAAARLGRSVALCGAIGGDAAGAAVRDALAAEGVDVSLLVRRPGDTPESVILLDATRATRSILHAPGAVLDRLSPAAAQATAAASWVHVDHAGWPHVAHIERARLSVDAGNPIDGLALVGVGVYAPTATSLRDRYPGRELGSAMRAALDEGARRVVVTLGEDGAVAADANGAWRSGPVQVDVRSTLGAGDVFHGALLSALVAGEELPEALRRANLAAALSCRGFGGRDAIPTAAELDAHLDTTPSAQSITLEEVR